MSRQSYRAVPEYSVIPEVDIGVRSKDMSIADYMKGINSVNPSMSGPRLRSSSGQNLYTQFH